MDKITSKNNINNLIYEIREKQVMLDSDLAKLYQCANGTKDVNKAVKRNLKRFPEDFYFQLTKAEYFNLKFQIGTSSLKNYGGVRKMPYVFTEQGVAMLSSVLRTEVASEVSIRIMRAFVAMRQLIGGSISRISNLETKVLEHDNEIKLLQASFDKFSEKHKSCEIYFNGQIYDAYSKILDILEETKKELIIIDNYADKTILDIIKNLNIKVTIITTNKYLTKPIINKYHEQYNNLKVVYNDTFHDRYFILDNRKVYHCGTSLNRIGYKTFSITEIQDKEILKSLTNKINTIT